MTTFQKWLLVSITVVGVFGAVVINNAVSTSKQTSTPNPKPEVKSEQTTKTETPKTTTQPKQSENKQAVSPIVSVTIPNQNTSPTPNPTTPTEPPKPPEVPFTASIWLSTTSPKIRVPVTYEINTNKQLSRCSMVVRGTVPANDFITLSSCSGSFTINVSGTYEMTGSVYSTSGEKASVWTLFYAQDYGF